MSWTTSFIVVADRDLAEAWRATGLVPLPGNPVSADEVLTGRDLPSRAEAAAARINGWCVIADGNFQMVEGLEGYETALADLSRGTLAAGFLAAGPTTTCAFRLWVDGVEQRFVVHEAGRVVEEHGTERPEEAGIPTPQWGYDEEWIFTVLERLTGLTWALIERHEFVLAAAPA